jgi:3-hydroxyacyl-CoA dehydrogenase
MKIKLPGPSGKAAIELFLYQMQQGGHASAHDVAIGKRLANVLTGGDIPANSWVTEQHLLDLEREAFLSLCGEEKTIARIQHMLQTNKPLRN